MADAHEPARTRARAERHGPPNIADRRDPSGPGGSDGVLAAESLVSTGPLCQDHAAVVCEVGLILKEHAIR